METRAKKNHRIVDGENEIIDTDQLSQDVS